jgi:hypothetical protein
MPSAVYATDGMDTIKLADEFPTCFDGLLKVTVRQSGPLLSYQGIHRCHDILDLKRSLRQALGRRSVGRHIH